ncbi:hypothetical protein C8R44DRAFT_735638 [Mycena epipterygia]|nr:hypothetical protein C8R44DRAFT_735638 [Mycena epipterygia]
MFMRRSTCILGMIRHLRCQQANQLDCNLARWGTVQATRNVFQKAGPAVMRTAVLRTRTRSSPGSIVDTLLVLYRCSHFYRVLQLVKEGLLAIKPECVCVPAWGETTAREGDETSEGQVCVNEVFCETPNPVRWYLNVDDADIVRRVDSVYGVHNAHTASEKLSAMMTRVTSVAVEKIARHCTAQCTSNLKSMMSFTLTSNAKSKLQCVHEMEHLRKTLVGRKVAIGKAPTGHVIMDVNSADNWFVCRIVVKVEVGNDGGEHGGLSIAEALEDVASHLWADGLYAEDQCLMALGSILSLDIKMNNITLGSQLP